MDFIKLVQESMEDTNYIIFNDKQHMFDLPDPYMKSNDCGFSASINTFIIENEKSVFNFFNKLDSVQSMILDKNNLIESFQSIHFQKSKGSYFAFAMNVGYRKEILKFLKEYSSLINNMYQSDDEKSKNKIAKDIMKDMVDKNLLAGNTRQIIDDYYTLNLIISLFGKYSEKKISGENRFVLEETNIQLRGNANINKIEVSNEDLDFHAKVLVKALKKINNKQSRLLIADYYFFQSFDISLFVKYANEFLGKKEEEKRLFVFLKNNLAKDIISTNPDKVFELIKQYMKLDLFNDFLDNILSKIREDQKFIFFKVFNLDQKRFYSIFEKHNLLPKEKITRKEYSVTDYCVNLMGFLSSEISIRIHKEKIMKVSDVLLYLFPDQKIEVSLSEIELKLKIFYEKAVSPDILDQREQKELYVIEKIFESQGEKILNLNTEDDIVKFARTILLEYELTQVKNINNKKEKKKI